jgi:hypothetical protein
MKCDWDEGKGKCGENLALTNKSNAILNCNMTKQGQFAGCLYQMENPVVFHTYPTTIFKSTLVKNTAAGSTGCWWVIVQR